MAGGDIQSLARRLESIQASLMLMAHTLGYIKAQNDQILRSRSTTSTDAPTATLFGRMRELYETGEFLAAISRFLLRHLLKIPAIAVGLREFLRWLGLG